ncbi:Protein CBG00991 [Caenorhabditis briggsae]|uniref:Protein CBG00991 n=1 Tax=Caenorhabditis briggsae TaxID=6238 RepID=A8WP57_CAEBR|nr:Protein CBG00991 [Caenorhabditis briggsae]CAP22263.2 Protein CBG00991 [Caenorhabditis briggsae]
MLAYKVNSELRSQSSQKKVFRSNHPTTPTTASTPSMD